ncbi:hypothetical protein [Paenibacillus sp. FSL L8-0333]|uniref:hypothetical protein n=1 Tax=unclassified Paenibacillus TaxID=185978 RepID=UPI0030D05F40
MEDGRRIRLRERTVIDEERSAAVGICQRQRRLVRCSRGVNSGSRRFGQPQRDTVSGSGVRIAAAEVWTAAARYGLRQRRFRQPQWSSVSGSETL